MTQKIGTYRLPHPRNDRRAAPGFTLIELLVVIVILGILVGLLVPAVMRAVGTARDAQTAAEIQAISQAIAAFKNQYGDLPPSRIVISENGDYSPKTLVNWAPLGPRSISYLKRFWPRLQFNTSSPGSFAPGLSASNFYDCNGSGTLEAEPYVLTGPECLVFFLGGVPQYTGGLWSVTGFAKSPTNPFQNATATNNRTAPHYEFRSDRLVPNNNNVSTLGYMALSPPRPDLVLPGYIDPLGSFDSGGLIPFYCYFSSYGGSGYDPGDCDGGGPITEADPSGGAALNGGFHAPGALLGNYPLGFATNIVSSPPPNPYTNSCPIATDGNGNAVVPPPGVAVKPRTWEHAQTYQIVSAGRDRVFGIGGQYIGQAGSTSGGVKLPFIDVKSLPPTAPYVPDSLMTLQANQQATNSPLGNGVRNFEGDNITNFSQGKLD